MMDTIFNNKFNDTTNDTPLDVVDLETIQLTRSFVDIRLSQR